MAFNHFHGFAVNNIGLIHKNGKYLLQDRIKEDWKGYTLPGDLRSSEEGTMHWIDEKDLSQANLVEDFGDLIEVIRDLLGEENENIHRF